MTGFQAMIWKSVRGKTLGRPVTTNAERNQGHWGGRADKTSIWRRASAKVTTEAMEAGEATRLDVAIIQVRPTYLKGPFPDVAAVAPTAKAVVDGLVDAGLIADDNPPHVDRVTFLRPVLGTVDGLAIRVITGDELPGHNYGGCDCRTRWEAQQARRKK